MTALVLIVEAATDFACSCFPKLAPWSAHILDAAILIVLLVPAFYLLIVRTLTDEFDSLKDEYEKSTARIRELAAIVQTAHESVVVTGLDGIIRYVNPSWEKMTGWRSAEVAGRLTPRILKSGRTDPATYEKLWRTITQGGSFRCELTNRRKDGSLYEVESSIAPLVDAAGNILGYAGLERDISRRKELEASARENDENRRLAEEAAQIGTWCWDIAADRMAWTPITRKQLGIGPEIEASYPNFLACVHPDDRERMKNAVQLALETRREYSEEFRCVWPDRSVHWFATRGQGFYDDAGRSIRMVGITLDITERKLDEETLRSTEARLRQAQKMECVGRLAGGVAHDFNNLLSVISGSTYFLLNGIAPDDPKRADIEEIRKAGDRAAALTRQLLAFSRKQILQPKVVDLKGVVREMESMLRRVIGEDIRMTVALREDPALVKADPGQIEQVVMNLAVNARDAMPEGGALTIMVDHSELTDDGSHPGIPDGPYVLLAVIDTGSGMEAAVLAHVFEPFFTTKETGKGTGLGLATVYGIVKQSGGGIYVDSEPGRGTIFRIYLPRARAALEASSPEPAPSLTDRGAETILLVDDDAAVRKIVQRMLAVNGYEVLEAQGPEDALRISEERKERIDLLLTDIVMPGIRGDELAGRIQLARPGMKVVFMSGYTESNVVRPDLSGSAEAFIQKPIESGVLFRKIRARLDPAREEAADGAYTCR